MRLKRFCRCRCHSNRPTSCLYLDGYKLTSGDFGRADDFGFRYGLGF